MRKRAREETTTIQQIYDEALQVLGKMTSYCYLIELLLFSFSLYSVGAVPAHQP